MKEQQIELDLINKLKDLKYSYREDIRDRAALERNFREKFEELNKVKLTDSEFSRLLEIIVTTDVYAAALTLRERNSFERDDGTPLNFTLVNIKDWCKNTFEVINQLRINTDNSHHRYDVILLINGVPVVQVELKTLQITPRRAMQQIVDYKNDLGNGYSKTLMCFLQIFVVSNRTDTWYFANNNTPKAQLFGFTGTPIFEENATYVKVEGGEASYKETKDIFQTELHQYTITHAIDDQNVLKFHVDYYKPDGGDSKSKLGERLAKKAIVEAILDKHDAAPPMGANSTPFLPPHPSTMLLNTTIC